MKFLKVICFLLTLIGGELYASSEVFEEANSAYEQGDYEQALAKYKIILESDADLPELNFNLATTYYQLDQLGESILYYEKALKLDPGNQKAKHNLQLAYLKSDNQIEPIPQLFFVEWWHQLLAYRNASSWAKWAVFFAWVSVALFIFSRLKEIRALKYMGWISLILCLSLAFLSFQKNNYDRSHQYAIVMTKEVALRETPNQKAEEVLVAFEGLKIEVVDSVDEWTKVQLEDETSGWIQTANIAKI